jgi:hypothetical protein
MSVNNPIRRDMTLLVAMASGYPSVTQLPRQSTSNVTGTYVSSFLLRQK